MGLGRNDAEHVFQSLRQGTVPERGLEAFAVGIEAQRSEIERMLDLAQKGEGLTKFLRGGYGCGKTFMARLATLDAQARNFATSFVVVSDSDLQFYKFNDVYRKVIAELGTKTCPRGALGDILDRWVGKIEDKLIGLGDDADGPGFDDKVRAKLEEELTALTRGKAPDDFVRVVRTIFDLRQKGEVQEAGELLSWLSGSSNVSAGAKKKAGIKGDIGSRDALMYLRGIAAIIKAAKYDGLVIVIDEVETLLRSKKDVREKSLNGIRQIMDGAKDFPGVLWAFTGTAEFFDGPRGVAGLAPLHDRIRFTKYGAFANPMQPQLELTPFDASRLRQVALKLREIYVAKNPDRVAEKVTPELIDRIVADVTNGFRGDVGVVPRQFLRTFMDVLDLVDRNEAFDPASALGIAPVDLSPQEEKARTGVTPDAVPTEPDDAKGYTAVVLDW